VTQLDPDMYRNRIENGWKNSAQTNKQTDKQTNRHYENNGHLAQNQLVSTCRTPGDSKGYQHGRWIRIWHPCSRTTLMGRVDAAEPNSGVWH